MNVLLIGPLFANAGHGAECGIFDALVNLGLNVSCFDPRTNDIVTHADGQERMFRHGWHEFTRAHTDWDLILCPGPGLPPKLYESGLLDMVNGTKVLWNSEPIRLANYRQRVKSQKDSFDIIATFDESELPLYEKMGVDRSFFLPQAFNPQWYKPLHFEPTYDFAFVGSVGGKWQNRIAFLNSVRHICDKNQWNFVAKQTFSAIEVNKIYNSARVVLNLGLYHEKQGPLGAFRSYALQQRIFEAIGAGRVTLTHDLGTETNQVLAQNRDVVCYSGPQDLEQSMSYAIKNWKDLSNNVLNIRNNHSYESRMNQLLGFI